MAEKSLDNRKMERKKKVLVIDDNGLNREILSEILKDEYEVLSAGNGEEGFGMLKSRSEELSLILLDAYMPVCDGFQFLERMQKDLFFSAIPVIVQTGSDKDEDGIRCLRLGATDFITKPYNPEILLARIRNIIRWRESLTALAAVEYDGLTGLYTLSAFCHQMEEQLSGGYKFDLVVLKIRDIAAIKSIYGEKKSGEVLKYVALQLKEAVPDAMISRNENEFFILRETSHRIHTDEILRYGKKISSGSPAPGLRLSVGIYPGIDAGQPAHVLCERAKTGMNSAAGDGIVSIAFYDAELAAKRMREQKMLLEFNEALQNHEFVFYLQPKVDLSSGRIAAAEALVRWIGKDGKLVSPGEFIPLLEHEDMITRLDEFIFRSVCAYQQKQEKLGMPVVPVSVNLSRNSLFSAGIVERYCTIAAEEGVNLSLVPIEITESAANAGPQIPDICHSFTSAGFKLHMDDFGTGYSSLSSLATLPFSVVKLDKSFVDRIENPKGSTIIRGIIETAQDLGLQVVAEGVEHRDQVEELSLLECDQIQGFYYSKPLSVSEFEKLLSSADPFAEKQPAAYFHHGITRISASELKRYLRVCRMMFENVRVVRPDCCKYCTVDRQGDLQEEQGPCYASWKRAERCSNCISLRSMETKKTEHKFEVVDDAVYLIYAVYIEVDGIPKVIELLNPMGEELLHGYQHDPNFLNIIRTENEAIYMDPQLNIYSRKFYEEQTGKLSDVTAAALLRIDCPPEKDNMLAASVETILSCIRKEDFLIHMAEYDFLLGFEGMDEQELPGKLETISVMLRKLYADSAPKTAVSIAGCSCSGVNQSVVDHLYQLMKR